MKSKTNCDILARHLENKEITHKEIRAEIVSLFAHASADRHLLNKLELLLDEAGWEIAQRSQMKNLNNPHPEIVRRKTGVKE